MNLNIKTYEWNHIIKVCFSDKISVVLLINQHQINSAEKYIKSKCRDLEKVRFDYLFRNGGENKVNKELSKFQNSDGGFGRALESDFLLPDSTPLATTIAFQFFEELTKPDENMIANAVSYLENSFVKTRLRWYCVNEKVNSFPHAMWWNWENGQTVIDKTWGNPTAEIIGYLNKYKKFLKEINIDELTEYAIKYWEEKTDFTSEHEVFCFIRLYNNLPKENALRLEKGLIKSTEQLVTYDINKWKEYTPQPLHFADNPNFFLFDTVKQGIETNLDYLVSSINENGIWEPNWTWRQYDDIWAQQKTKWEGVITIKNLLTLTNYKRVSK